MIQKKKQFEIEPEGAVNKIVKCLDSLPPEKLLAVLFQACFHMQEKIDDIHDECVHVVKTAGEEEVWDEQKLTTSTPRLRVYGLTPLTGEEVQNISGITCLKN